MKQQSILIKTLILSMKNYSKEKIVERSTETAIIARMKVKDGVKALMIYEKKLLLILRDNNPNIPWPNVWNLPGGGVEDNENYDEALRRELLEEVGIAPQKYTILGKQTFEDGRVVIRYLVSLNKEEVEKLVLGEGQKMEFFSIDEITNLSFSPYLGNFIQKNKEELRKMIEKSEAPTPEKLGLVPL